MLFMITCFLSLLLTKIVIVTNDFHGAFTVDSDMVGAQKYHTTPTPRVGGVPILLSFLLAMYILEIVNSTYIGKIHFHSPIRTFIPVLIVFAAGLLEDLTKLVPPIMRMLLFLISIIIAIYFTDSMPSINVTGWNYLNNFLIKYSFISFLITFFCVIGVTNAYNIIDGYHGLATLTAIANLLGLLAIAYAIKDYNATSICIGFVGALSGFLFYNYPRGKIFMGDGGAYMVGFSIAAISLNMIEIHTTVSPYAILLMGIYPVTEMGFSIYRKKFLTHTPATQPDGLHFHMMVYKRTTSRKSNKRNPTVVLLMLPFILPQIFIAYYFRTSDLICIAFIFAYIILYTLVYFRIVRFKMPFMMKWAL